MVLFLSFITSAVIFFINVLIWKKLGYYLLGPFHMFNYFFVLYNWIGIFFVVIYKSSSFSLWDDFIYLKYWTIFNIGWLALNLGGYFSYFFFKNFNSKNKIFSFFIVKSFSSHKTKLIKLIIIFIGLFLILIIKYKFILLRLIANPTNYFEIRYNLHVSYISYILSKSIILLITSLISIYIVYSNIKINKKIFLLTFIFILNIIASAITLQKAPIANSILLFILLFYYRSIQKDRKINPFIFLKKFLSLVIVLSIVLIYFIKITSNSNLIIALEAYIKRLILLGPFLNYEAILFLDNKIHSLFLGGISFPTLFEIFNLPNIYLGKALYDYVFNRNIDVGTANTCFFTAIYGDFGIIGSIVFLFLFGFLLYTIQLILIKDFKKNFHVSFAFFLTLSILSTKFNYTHLGTALLSEGFGVIFLLYLLLKFLISLSRS